MSGRETIDDDSAGADCDEGKAESLRVPEREPCDVGDAAAEETTLCTAACSPHMSSCTAMVHDEENPSSPLPPAKAPSRRTKEARKELKSHAKRAIVGFRHFFDVKCSLDTVAEHIVPERDTSTPRSAGRSITGRKDRSRCAHHSHCFLLAGSYIRDNENHCVMRMG